MDRDRAIRTGRNRASMGSNLGRRAAQASFTPFLLFSGFFLPKQKKQMGGGRRRVGRVRRVGGWDGKGKVGEVNK